MVGRVFAYEFVMDSKGIKCLDENGNYAKGWINQSGFIFWFDQEGYMVTGKQVLDNREYIFNYGAAAYAPIGALISDGMILNEKHDCSIRYVEGYNARFDNGKTIVLIHGLTGSIEDSMTLAQHYMAYGFRVLIPELVAHGHSTVTANVPQIIAWSTIGIEEIINKYISAQTPTVSIIGTSLGGMIGSCIVRDLKGKVDKLALLISTYDFSDLNDKLFFNTYYKGQPVEELERTSIKQLLRGMNPNNDPNLFDYTKVYLIQSTTDDIIPYLSSPRSGIDFHPTSAKGHNLKDSDYFESFDFLLAGAKKYVPTEEEKSILNIIKIEDAQSLERISNTILATNLPSTPQDVKTGLEEKIMQASEAYSSDGVNSASTKGPGLKENGEALTKEEVEEIQESMEASGEFIMARAILG